MTHKIANFSSHAGDVFTMALTLYQADGVTILPLPTAALTVRYQLAASPGGLALVDKDSTGADVTIVTPPAGDDGRVDVKLQPAETTGFDGKFHYRVAVIDIPTGEQSTVLTGVHTLDASIGGTADTGETADARQRLAEAKAAYHQISTSQMPVKVDTGNGQSVTYVNSPEALGQLQAYIAKLEAEINPGAVTSRRRPLRPYF